jgi:hypothetical protein
MPKAQLGGIAPVPPPPPLLCARCWLESRVAPRIGITIMSGDLLCREHIVIELKARRAVARREAETEIQRLTAEQGEQGG